MERQRLEIREESEEDQQAYAAGRPFSLYDDGLRHSWHDTREEALQEARELLIKARAHLAKAREEWEDAQEEARALTFALVALEKV